MKPKLLKFSSRNRFTFLFLLPLLLLYGCPYSSIYKIDDAPSVLAEDAFIGNWAAMVMNGAGTALPLKMGVSKKNEYEYDLHFTGNIHDLRYYNVLKEDTIKGTAFISELASRKFLNIQVRGQFYIAEYIYKDDKISLLPLCEHFTVKYIKSCAELKEALVLQYKTRLYPLYDEPFCLKEMVRVN